MIAFTPQLWLCCGLSMAIESDSMKCTYMKNLCEISLKSGFSLNFGKYFLFLAQWMLFRLARTRWIKENSKKFPFVPSLYLFVSLLRSYSLLHVEQTTYGYNGNEETKFAAATVYVSTLLSYPQMGTATLNEIVRLTYLNESFLRKFSQSIHEFYLDCMWKSFFLLENKDEKERHIEAIFSSIQRPIVHLC